MGSSKGPSGELCQNVPPVSPLFDHVSPFLAQPAWGGGDLLALLDCSELARYDYPGPFEILAGAGEDLPSADSLIIPGSFRDRQSI